MHLIKIGRRVINTDHLIDAKLDAIADPGTMTRAHIVNCVDGRTFQVPAESPEGQALRWWLLDADRAPSWNWLTIDIVAEHQKATSVHAEPFPVDELIREFRVMPPADEGHLLPAS